MLNNIEKVPWFNELVNNSINTMLIQFAEYFLVLPKEKHFSATRHGYSLLKSTFR